MRLKAIYGFTLPEMMLALSFSALLMLSVAKTYPVLREHQLHHTFYHRVDAVLRQMMFQLEKDLRRAGFCRGDCNFSAIKTDRFPGEAPDSCLLLAYDVNRNGQLEVQPASASEWFGYRLKEGAIETHRGMTDCHGGGWEKLHDEKEIVITHFSVKEQQHLKAGRVFTVHLEGQWRQKPRSARSVTSWINNVNLE